jgi:Fur family ferric uptake transcriptional regulator
MEIFQGQQRQHLTAEDVHRRMMEHHADVGLATVYRVLGQLADVGILLRHVFDSGVAVYELQHDHHDHIICLSAGRVDEFTDEVIEQRQRSIADSQGYYSLSTSLHCMATVRVVAVHSTSAQM